MNASLESIIGNWTAKESFSPINAVTPLDNNLIPFSDSDKDIKTYHGFSKINNFFGYLIKPLISLSFLSFLASCSPVLNKKPSLNDEQKSDSELYVDKLVGKNNGKFVDEGVDFLNNQSSSSYSSSKTNPPQHSPPARNIRPLGVMADTNSGTTSAWFHPYRWVWDSVTDNITWNGTVYEDDSWIYHYVEVGMKKDGQNWEVFQTETAVNGQTTDSSTVYYSELGTWLEGIRYVATSKSTGDTTRSDWNYFTLTRMHKWASEWRYPYDVAGGGFDELDIPVGNGIVNMEDESFTKNSLDIDYADLNNNGEFLQDGNGSVGFFEHNGWMISYGNSYVISKADKYIFNVKPNSNKHDYYSSSKNISGNDAMISSVVSEGDLIKVTVSANDSTNAFSLEEMIFSDSYELVGAETLFGIDNQSNSFKKAGDVFSSDNYSLSLKKDSYSLTSLAKASVIEGKHSDSKKVFDGSESKLISKNIVRTNLSKQGFSKDKNVVFVTEYVGSSNNSDTLSGLVETEEMLFTKNLDNGLIVYTGNFGQKERKNRSLGLTFRRKDGAYANPNDFDLEMTAFKGVVNENHQMKIFHSNFLKLNETGLHDLIKDFNIVQTSVYPNPANPFVKISYGLIKEKNVKIEIYDLLGRRVKTLINKHQSRGNHSLTWNVKGVASGVYIVKVQKDKEKPQIYKQMILK